MQVNCFAVVMNFGHAIKYCIPQSLITSSQVDHVACGQKPNTESEHTLAIATLFCTGISCFMSNWLAVLRTGYKLHFLKKVV